MIISKKTMALWLSTALSFGLIGGYIFSSKFCSVSIARRVEKISSLNQNMRRLFSLRNFYNFILLSQQNNMQKDVIKEQIMRINHEISMLVGNFYDAPAQQRINNLLTAQLDAQSPEQRMDCDNQIAAFLAELNPSWATSKNFMRTNLTQTDQNISEIKESLRNKDTQKVFTLFERVLDDSLEFSDEISRGITAKLPNKF